MSMTKLFPVVRVFDAEGVITAMFSISDLRRCFRTGPDSCTIFFEGDPKPFHMDGFSMEDMNSVLQNASLSGETNTFLDMRPEERITHLGMKAI